MKITINFIKILIVSFSLSSCAVEKKINIEEGCQMNLNSNTENLKILSYNLGLLRIKAPFIDAWEFTPHLEERLFAIPDAIRSVSPDIIAFQEVYQRGHQDFIIEKLSKEYPCYVRSNIKATPLRQGDGLLLLSKYPITSSSFTRFSNAPFVEKIVVKKGFLASEIKVSDDLSISIINTHLSAGGLGHPETAKADSIRGQQIAEVKKFAENGGYHFIVGDFNAGTSNDAKGFVSKDNFDDLLSGGYLSAYDYAIDNLGVAEEYTWSIENTLNVSSPHDTSPSQRIDHVLLLPEALMLFEIQNAEVVFKDSTVSVNVESEASKVTISDHYGLLVDLKI